MELILFFLNAADIWLPVRPIFLWLSFDEPDLASLCLVLVRPKFLHWCLQILQTDVVMLEAAWFARFKSDA